MFQHFNMSEGGPNKRKSKGWYRKQAYLNKRQKTDVPAGHRLAPGQKGFLITCNDRERDAVKESYNILNEYADKLYGPEVISHDALM
jgi:tRNA acetyltransferase TAN1